MRKFFVCFVRLFVCSFVRLFVCFVCFFVWNVLTGSSLIQPTTRSHRRSRNTRETKTKKMFKRKIRTLIYVRHNCYNHNVSHALRFLKLISYINYVSFVKPSSLYSNFIFSNKIRSTRKNLNTVSHSKIKRSKHVIRQTRFI